MRAAVWLATAALGCGSSVSTDAAPDATVIPDAIAEVVDAADDTTIPVDVDDDMAAESASDASADASAEVDAEAAPPSVVQWAMGPGINNDYGPPNLAMHPSGDLLVAANTIGALTFGGATTCTLSVAGTILVRLAAADGKLAWSRCLPRLALWSRGLGADAAGNVYLVGYALSIDEIEAHSFDASGLPRWSRSYATAPDAAYGIARSAAVESTGRLFFTGETTGVMDFGTGALPMLQRFVVTLRPDGSTEAVKTLALEHTTQLNGSAVDTALNRFIVGRIPKAKGDFGGGSSDYPTSGFVASYSSTGAYRWANTYAGDAYFETTNVANDISVTYGWVIGELAISATDTVGAVGVRSEVLLGLNATTGSLLWRRASATRSGRNGGIDVSSSGRVFTALTDATTGLRVHELDAKGTPTWTWEPTLAPMATSSASAILVSPSGDVFISGAFSGDVTFGATKLSAPKADSSWVQNLFLAKLLPPAK